MIKESSIPTKKVRNKYSYPSRKAAEDEIRNLNQELTL